MGDPEGINTAARKQSDKAASETIPSVLDPVKATSCFVFKLNIDRDSIRP